MLVASERPWLAKSSDGMMDEYCPWLRYVSDTTAQNDPKPNPDPPHLQGVAEQPEKHVHKVAEKLGDKGRLPEVSRAAHLGHELCPQVSARSHTKVQWPSRQRSWLTSEDHGTTVGEHGKLHTGDLGVPSGGVPRNPARNLDGVGKIGVTRLARDGQVLCNTDHGHDHDEDVDPDVEVGEPSEVAKRPDLAEDHAEDGEELR
jgi:hypothetical protein